MDQSIQRRVVNKRVANRVIEAMEATEILTRKISVLAGQADQALAPISNGERASQAEIVLRSTKVRRDLAEIAAHASEIGREVTAVFDVRNRLGNGTEEK